MKIYKTWEELKSLMCAPKNLKLQYFENDKKYIIFIVESSIEYTTEIWKDLSNVEGIDEEQNSLDLTDFEDNYKDNCNNQILPLDEDGKQFVRAESRPLNKTTYFTCAGDSQNNIGDGKELKWDFSDTEDELDLPTGSNYRHKRLEFYFIDPINIKEGTIYFENASKWTYLRFYVVCPAGNYYLDNDGNPVLAEEDIPIDMFVNKQFIYGNCPMGDELNTEAASLEIPTNYKFWIDIVTPNINDTGFGHINLEAYRARTQIL